MAAIHSVDEYFRDEGDYEMVARFLAPLDAHVVCDCLKAAGVPALVADANLAQIYSIASGGARVLVPPSRVAEAQAVIAAFHRGDFALRDDDDSFLSTHDSRS
jgi:Putative prokaryotic signal transducing protein